MKEYFEKLDFYIDLKIKYAKIDLEENYQYKREILQAKNEVETAFLVLLRNNKS